MADDEATNGAPAPAPNGSPAASHDKGMAAKAAGVRQGNYTWDAGAWLEAFAELGDAERASQTLGITRRSAYYRRRADPEFRRLWDEVRDARTDELEDSVANRCLNGVVEDDIQCVAEVREKDPKTGRIRTVRKFEKVGQRIRYPDVLTIFWLKACRPWLYSESGMQARALAAGDAESVQVQAQVDLRRLSQEGRDALRVFLREQLRAERAAIAESREAPLEGA